MALRQIVLAAVLGLGLLGGSPAAAQIREGVYDLQGANPDGSTYSGSFGLQAAAGVGWVATWALEGMRIPGLAIVQGGVLAIAYVVQGRPGVAAYEVDSDGRLRGTWTTGGGIGTEVLTPR